MKEKFKEFMGSEKFKQFFKKVFSKKVIITVIVIVIITAGLKIGYSLMFQLKGTVLKVDGSNITVANFFTTQTVNIGDLQTDSNKLYVGEKVKINKNLYGSVISVQTENMKHYGDKRRAEKMPVNQGTENK